MKEDSRQETAKWYCQPEAGEAHGPYTAKQVKLLYYQGALGTEPLVWQAGMAEWLPYRTCFGATSVLGAIVSSCTGLRGLGNMSFCRFFSQVFKRHTLSEAKQTLRGTPSDEPVYLDGTWPTPWLYSRVLLWGVVLAALLFSSYFFMGATSLIFSIPVASFVAPFAVFILFTELNVRRDLSFNKTFWWALLISPIISLPLSAFVENYLDVEMHWAGPIEEPAKILAALFLARVTGMRCNRILRGMMLGCAVGMGFAFWETIGYIAGSFDKGGLFGAMGNALLRASDQPFAHTVWTAITMGAFCLVQGEREQKAPGKIVEWSVLLRWKFLRIAMIPVLMHAAHNWTCGHVLEYFGLPIICHIGLYLISWELALQLIKAGLLQTRGQLVESSIHSAPLPEQPEPRPELPREETLPELPRLVEPGVHGESIFCPACNGRGGLTPVHHCNTCKGEGCVPVNAPCVSHPQTSGHGSLLRFLTVPSFKGRISRRRYWLSVLALNTLVSLSIYSGSIEALQFLFALIAAWSAFIFASATVRRLHDVGRRGWWALALPFSCVLLFTPWAALFFFDSSPGQNRWGANPKG